MKDYKQDIKTFPHSINLTAFITVIFLSVTIHMSAQADSVPDGRVVHVIMMWFDDSVTAEQLQQVIEVTRGFSEIPGVVEIRVGETLQVGGGNIDNSYSVGAYIVFENEVALEEYANHPIHVAAKQSGVLDGLERMVVYNFTDRQAAGMP